MNYLLLPSAFPVSTLPFLAPSPVAESPSARSGFAPRSRLDGAPSNFSKTPDRLTGADNLLGVLASDDSGPATRFSGPPSYVAKAENRLGEAANRLAGAKYRFSGAEKRWSGPATRLTGPAIRLSGAATRLSGPPTTSCRTPPYDGAPPCRWSGTENRFCATANRLAAADNLAGGPKMPVFHVLAPDRADTTVESSPDASQAQTGWGERTREPVLRLALARGYARPTSAPGAGRR